jgi:hypothetical protein
MKCRDTQEIIGDRLLIGVGVCALSALALGVLRLSWLMGKAIASDWGSNWPYAVFLLSPVWLYLIGWAIEVPVLNYMEGAKKEKEN